jgi:hypothetical protein
VETHSQVVVQILGATEALVQKLNWPRNPMIDKPFYDQNLAAARTKLSEEEFNANWEIGTKMSLEQAIELALKMVEEM